MGGVGEPSLILSHVQLNGGADLAEVVQAAGTPAFFRHAPGGGQTEGGQNAHDGDDGKELNQGEGAVGFFHL